MDHNLRTQTSITEQTKQLASKVGFKDSYKKGLQSKNIHQIVNND